MNPKLTKVKLGNVCFSTAYVAQFPDAETFAEYHLTNQKMLQGYSEADRRAMFIEAFHIAAGPRPKRGRPTKTKEPDGNGGTGSEELQGVEPDGSGG